MLNQDIKFLLLEGIHPNAETFLRRAGFHNITTVKTALEGEALAEALQSAEVIGIRSRTQLTESVLAAAKPLKAIGCFCIGTNQVDLQAAGRFGVPVFNAPYSNTRSVAELVIAEIICLLRGLTDRNQAVHAGQWPKDARGSFEARGKTLGIVGYGNIGSQLSILAESLGMTVIFYDAVTKLPLGNAEAVDSLSTLLQRADVVSLHVPEIPSTKNLIAAAQLAEMKQGAVLINAARGHCVAIEDLAAALQSGHLAGAALDVFPVEPKSNDEPLHSVLRGLKNVILTPHIGGSTIEAQANIGLEVANKLEKFLNFGDTIGAVNFPEVALPVQAGTHRLLHVHENRPGMLSAVNRIIAESNANIAAQSLMTRGEIGYLLMDVAHDDAPSVLKALRGVDGTVRARRIF